MCGKDYLNFNELHMWMLKRQFLYLIICIFTKSTLYSSNKWLGDENWSAYSMPLWIRISEMNIKQWIENELSTRPNRLTMVSLNQTYELNMSQLFVVEIGIKNFCNRTRDRIIIGEVNKPVISMMEMFWFLVFCLHKSAYIIIVWSDRVIKWTGSCIHHWIDTLPNH